MMIITKKLNPSQSVVKQVGGFNNGNYQPVLIHQHTGRISRVMPSITTDRLPKQGNYAKTVLKT